MGFLQPQLFKVLKVVCWAGSAPFPPSVTAEAGSLSAVAAGVHVFISGESLHCFLVGWCTNKSYVIATSDLWLFIHASNLLPSTPHPTPLHEYYILHIIYHMNGTQVMSAISNHDFNTRPYVKALWYDKTSARELHTREYRALYKG